MVNKLARIIISILLCVMAAALVCVPDISYAADDAPKLSVPKVTSSTVSLKWTRAKDATKYEVQRRNTETGKYEVLGVTTKLSWEDKHLTPGKSYRYRVRVYNGDKAGVVSKYINTKTKAGIAAPGSFSLKSIGNRRAQVSWNAVKGAKGYTVYVKPNGGVYEPVLDTNKTSVKLALKKGPASFSVYVRAYNSEGEGKLTKAKSITPSFSINGTLLNRWVESSKYSSVQVESYKIGSNVAYIARIKTTPAHLKTSTVVGPNETPRTQKTSAQAKKAGALIAVNGDYYNYYTRRNNYLVIRNGVIYRDLRSSLDSYLVYNNGSAEVATAPDLPGAAELVAKGVKHAFIFGPGLVKNGKRMSFTKTYGHEGAAPRTAIGQISANEWVLVVVDGRQSGYSVGMNYTQLADIFLRMGCKTAFNLDGGGSSCVYLKGHGVLNRPSDTGGERYVTDIVYFD